MKLEGKVVVITGASEGIGRATAKAFAAAGARVVATARSQTRLASLVSEIEGEGGRAVAISMDVASDESVARGVARAVEAHGAIDVLVNNAGYGLVGALDELSLDEVRAVFEVNVFGLLRCTQAVVRHMRPEGGAIVNVSSVLGRVTLPYMGAYSATKHAVNSMSAAMRAELRERNVNVILVMPGRVRTKFSENSVRHGFGSLGGHEGIEPEALGRAIVDAVRGDKREIVVPGWNRLLRAGRALAPDFVDERVARALRRSRVESGEA